MKNNFAKFGLIAAAVMIILNLVLYVTNMSFETWASWVVILASMVVIGAGCVNFANINNNQVAYGNVFVSGLKTSLVAASIVLVWAIISIFIFPEMKEKALQHISEELARKNVSEDIAEKSLEMTRKGYYYFVIGGSFLGTFIWGLIASLIGGGLAKKQPKMPEIMNNN